MVTDLGEQPPPRVEPAEPPPGGVDAVEEVQFEESAVVPDLSRLGNERSKNQIPESVTDPSETDDGASSDGASHPEQEEPP
jgi:hypothetical protein